MRSRVGSALGVVVVSMTLVSHPVFCQDPPRVRGFELPPTYHQRLQQGVDASQITSGWIAKSAAARANNVALEGSLPVVIILALLADSPEPTFSNVAVQEILFDGTGAERSIGDYYTEVSGGRFTVTGQVLPWIRTSVSLDQVVGNPPWPPLPGIDDYMYEALVAADELVDFGLFDNDGPDGIPNSGDDNGEVDAVAFEYIEVAASCDGPGIWPHRSTTDFVTNDLQPNGHRIRIRDMIMQSAVDCGGDDIQTASTIAHELGHVIGLPDLYDRSHGSIEPENRYWVVGCWGLMAAGAWSCGVTDRDGWYRPTHFSAWAKQELGWLSNIIEIEDVFYQEFSLEPVIQSEQVLRIPLETTGPTFDQEYLLVEYRTQEGFDLDLPASGVLVYHVDPDISSNQSSYNDDMYMVQILEADSNSTLQNNFANGGNRGEAGDAWGVFGPGSLTNSSNPSIRLQTGGTSPVTIHEISIDNGVATVLLSTRRILNATLLQSFFGSNVTALTTEEIEHLDSFGNNNGSYDVGDFRAYLQRF